MDHREFDTWYDLEVDTIKKNLPEPDKVPTNQIEALVTFMELRGARLAVPYSDTCIIHTVRFEKIRDENGITIWKRKYK